MVRTRADNTARKAVAAKAPRKNYASSAGPSSTSPTSGSKKDKSAGGNPYCPRPTPDWQKEITNFFIKTPRADKENEDLEDDAGAGGSGSSSSKVTDNTEDIPTSSKTLDKKKIKKSKDSTEESKAKDGTRDDAAGDKMDDGEAVTTATTSQQDNEPMEVEIEITDKKQDEVKDTEPQEKESPKAFQKNNCISDSDEDD